MPPGMLTHMPFPRRLLNDNEEVALDLRPHWWFFAGPVAAGIPVVALLVSVLQLHGDTRSIGLYVFAAVAVVWAVWLGGRLLRWQTTHFVVTSDRLILRRGVLGKFGREIPLERVNDITFRQSLFERMIGAGDLVVESAGERGQDSFDSVPHPDRVQQVIYREMEALAARRSGAAPAAPGVPQQIAQLAELRDRGLLSPEEFEAKKAQLLERM